MSNPPDAAPAAPAKDRSWGLFSLLRADQAPLDLRLLGRTLLHAAVVGIAAGLVGAAFFAGLEYAQSILLEHGAGYVPLRAHGETFVKEAGHHVFRWWVLLFLPALGALLAGVVMRLAPETAGGGGDQMIHAFHHQGGVIRRRVIWVKALASMLTLGTGGAGGREGPTMQIGAALGSTLGSLLNVTARERRILMVAGVAAGMAAVFRTPLGAALLAVEVLYRDDFESDALIPAVLASVVAYSVVIAIFGETTLFARAPRYPFHPLQLPLYLLLAVLIAALAVVFVRTLRAVQSLSLRFPGPAWTRPAIGGLALGVFAVPIILLVGNRLGNLGQGLGLLGGGYGAAQMAVTGSDQLPGGWVGVELLFLLCLAKLVAASLTIGTGGSAGDFAPSLVLGGLMGGAFGRAAQLLLNDPTIDPGAFALVGMGTFYGGIAHAPMSALILVSELAGSYDLLVPLMMTSAIAFVALRRHSLYAAQPATKADSPVYRRSPMLDQLRIIRVRDVMVHDRPFATFGLKSSTGEILERLGEDSWQDVFPVLDDEGRMAGIIPSDALRYLMRTRDITWTIAADLMHPPVFVRPEDDLRKAASLMISNSLREVPVVGEDGRVIGFLDESETAKAYLDATHGSGTTGQFPAVTPIV